jgi:dTMP kinase
VFITFEGPEGAGKSSVANILARWLRDKGQEVATTREPGGSHFGPKVRSILLEEGELSAEAELFLFLADRAEHVSKLIRPWLEEGKVVLCDRFSDSTVVYQGYGRGLDLQMLRELNRMACGGLEPDLTFLLDISPETSLKRLTAMDRMDREPLEFHEKVREGFLTEARRDPNRWVVIDASLPLDDVAELCKVKLKERRAPVVR